MLKLEITDLTKLRITKVTDYKVYFDYEGERYFLLSTFDEECHLSLYKRDIDNNKIRVTFINSRVTSTKIYELVKDISKKRPAHPVYSNIDREYFVKKLVQLDMVSGLYQNEYKDIQHKIYSIRNEIAALQRKIQSMEHNWMKTSNHGSKCYDHSIKYTAAERISGAQAGDWCKEYNDHYGSTHPEYGGILTDLFSLPVGTEFYVTNGLYKAEICVDEHGDKCILTRQSCEKLTDDHHSLYIVK